MSSRPTIVLVHCAFANAGCWAKLVPLLRAKHFDVVASHCPLSSLADDVSAVRRTITMQDGPVLLVGHSWGGAIITEAGNEPQARGLVYIAAAAPDSGQSFNEWWKDYPVAPGASDVDVRLRINVAVHDLMLDSGATLLDMLREHLHLFGAKKGCDHGQCGPCSVRVDGRRALSCLTLAKQGLLQSPMRTSIHRRLCLETIKASKNEYIPAAATRLGPLAAI